jgi:hypothetical protein
MNTLEAIKKLNRELDEIGAKPEYTNREYKIWKKKVEEFINRNRKVLLELNEAKTQLSFVYRRLNLSRQRFYQLLKIIDDSRIKNLSKINSSITFLTNNGIPKRARELLIDYQKIIKEELERERAKLKEVLI